MTDRILMIAYHVPPCDEVSGALRTLSMARYLLDVGWKPIILAPSIGAYPTTGRAALSMLPDGCEVFRSFALDARRHLGIGGRYPETFAQPDRWASWWLSATPLGLRLVQRYRPKAIWSTYPIATAHLIAASLHRLTRVPWIADFRDPMTMDCEKHRSLTMRTRERLERRVMARADACVFVTQAAKDLYAARYQDVRHGAFELIPNGFDEESYEERLGMPNMESHEPRKGAFTLVHSGVLYPSGRDPEAFFKALAGLKKRGDVSSDTLRVVLRGSGTEEQSTFYAALLNRYDVSDLVELAPMTKRDDVLVEQYRADGLLLFQGAEFNAQIPAKIYEYFRARKPIFALADSAGETARLVRDEKVGVVADIERSSDIQRQLLAFMRDVAAGTYRPMGDTALMKYSRREGGKRLHQLIEELVER